MPADPSRAVFLSYASQDVAAVERIAEALRATGIEVWFDKNELVGGDAWDQKIRRQIRECALFVPVISANTNARAEGYFRLEWKLAVDRSHLMADDAPFLFPVVIDDTSDAAARVPDRFREVQWTRLNVKDTPESLAARVAKILGGPGSTTDIARAARRADETAAEKKSSPVWLRHAWAIFGLLIGLFYAIRPLWNFGGPREKSAPPAAVKSAVPAPKLSEARQLAEKARALFDKINSNVDDFATAEGLLKRALELDANDGVIWAYSARLNSGYLTRSFERNPARAEAARSQAERAVKLAPDSAEAWHALGRGIWASDLPRAEEALRHALQLAPHDGRLLLSLGSICRIQGRMDDALAFYVQAAAHPDVKPLAFYDQFLIHLYMRRFAEADRCVRESIAGLPTTNNITGLAMLEFAWRGRTEVAQRELATAPSELRGEPRIVFATALLALVAQQTDEALHALDRLPGDFINDAWYSGPKALLTGVAHAQAGRPEAARIAWEAGLNAVRRRLQDAPNDAEFHLRLGELLAWTGQTDAALREARAFEELQRNRTDWTFSSARIYAALGRADEALPILEKLLAVTAAGRWPLTPMILRLDPIWSKLRDDPRFQKLATSDQSSLSATPVAKPDAKSVAVLAFENRSDDKTNEYFSDGIADELLTTLQKIPGLKVAAHASAWSFKGKGVTTREIGEKLDVAHVVEGSVQKSGNRVKITARLSKAATNEEVWSESFGPIELTDVFATQSELAQAIVAKLRGRLTGETAAAAKSEIAAQVQAATRGGTKNAEAHQLYLQGKFFANQFSVENLARAAEFFDRAVKLDPAFALAWAALARARTVQGEYASTEQELREHYTVAREASQRALALEPNLAETQMALFEIQISYDFDWRGARESMGRALALAPSDALAVHNAAQLAHFFGEAGKSIELGRQAVALDPVNAELHHALGNHYSHAGRTVEAAAERRRAIELSPNPLFGHGSLAVNLARQGKFDEALAAAEREQTLWARLTAFAFIYWETKNTAKADEALKNLIDSSASVAACQVAELYARRGEKDVAFQWLERAYRQRDSGLAFAKLDPDLVRLHDDPRWEAFLKKMGLSDEQLK